MLMGLIHLQMKRCFTNLKGNVVTEMLGERAATSGDRDRATPHDVF